METYRLTIEYEGTRYRGWQVQQNARSVAGELLRALAAAGAPVAELGGSGRTDAGVHALAQSAHLRLRERRDPEALRRAVNAELARDVHVLAIAAAPARFHARHDALLRSYLYQVSRRRTAFAKPFVWWVRDRLDLAAMGRAAALLPGRHDFARFCERPAEQESTLCQVDSVTVAEAEALVLVRIVASHFLWKMVRRLVGALVRVGTGKLGDEELTALLGGGELSAGRPGPGPGSGPAAGPASGRNPAEWTAPPSGLFLERVLYRGDPPLGPPRPVTPVPLEPRPRPPAKGARPQR
ncbi:MAG TPA: tRNA pseudouridine(38-40) synthase TruA [Thermoanaerobaculia bacterium]|nr:tRNA pseudouridine(38-40) synthase TruA [Thermoanaerobaculia bacterium]